MRSEWAKWKAEMLFADFQRGGAMGLYDALVEAQERGAQQERRDCHEAVAGAAGGDEAQQIISQRGPMAGAGARFWRQYMGCRCYDSRMGDLKASVRECRCPVGVYVGKRRAKILARQMEESRG